MLLRKSILFFLLIAAYACEILENPKINDNSFEAWIYSSRLPCDLSIPRSGFCYYYSTANTYDLTKWKPFDYEIEDFGFATGYYYKVELEEFIPEMSEDVDDLMDIIEDEIETKHFRVKTIILKQRNYLSTLSGTWYLEDLNGYEDKDVIINLKKSITIDPLNRILMGEYNCQPITFKLKNYIDLNRIEIEEVEIIENECPDADGYRNLEENFRRYLSETKYYELDGRVLHLKNNEGHRLLTFSRGFNPRGDI